MDKFDDQLNKLPKFKLGRRADLRIRWHFFASRWQRSRADWLVGLKSPRFRLAAVSLVLLALVIYIPSYSYASASVTEGHWLYPIKHTIETVEINLQTTPEDQAVVNAKMAERRLEEAAYLAERTGSQEAQVADTIKKALVFDQASEAALEKVAPSEAKTETVNKITDKKVNQVESLSQVAQGIGLHSSEDTLDTISLALETAKAAPGESKSWPARTTRPDRRVKTDRGKAVATSSEENAGAGDDAVWQDTAAATGTLPQMGENDEGTIATGTGNTIKFDRPGRNLPPGQAKKVEQDYKAVKEEVSQFENNLKQNDYNEEDVNSLFTRLRSKLDKAQENIDEGQLDEASSVLDTTEALKNNAEHFIRPNQENNDAGDMSDSKNKKNKINKKDNNDSAGDNEKDIAVPAQEPVEPINSKTGNDNIGKNNETKSGNSNNNWSGQFRNWLKRR